MQLQHARSAAKYRNICSSEDRELHERGVVKRDTALYRRWECTEGVNETFTLFRAKRDAGTKTSALIQGMCLCFWLMLGNARIC